MLSALCHIAVEIFWGDKSAIYRTKITFPLYCKSPQLSVSPVKCAKVICCPALGCFLYDYKIDLNLTPSLGHFYFTAAQTMLTLNMKRTFSCGQLKLFKLRSLFHWLMQNDEVLKLSDAPFCGA